MIKQWIEDHKWDYDNNILWASVWREDRPYYELGVHCDVTNWCFGIGFDFDPAIDMQFTIRLGPWCWYLRREKHAT